MRGRASIWDCDLCVSIGGVNGGLGGWERAREREREENLMTFYLFLVREFNDLMTWY